MPPVYETLLLNTAVPQIQAAQAGDSYVMVVNATTPALRITQTGTGNAISVEDEANPDSSPFVVTAAGDVGIGTDAPAAKLHIAVASAAVDGTKGVRIANPAGTIAVFECGSTGDSFIGTTSGSDFNIRTGNTVRATFDNSGNLGLGVTPSAWGSDFRALNVVQFSTRTAALFGGSGRTGLGLSLGVYHNNTNWIASVSSAPVAVYEIDGNGAHTWSTYNGTVTAGNAISFTQAMTLDASGRLMIGTTTPQQQLTVSGAGTNDGSLYFNTTLQNATTAATSAPKTGINFQAFYQGTTALANFAGISGGKENATDSNSAGVLIFSTAANSAAPAERARITSGGDFRVKGAGTAGSTEAFQVSGSAPADAARLDSSGNLLVGKTSSADNVVGSMIRGTGYITATWAETTDPTTTYHVYSTGAAAYRFYVGLGGTVYATNTTISAISDQRLKENIRDLDVGLEAIMALKPRKFDWKTGRGKDKKDDRGFVAQEFEQVFPDLIDEWKDPAPEGEEPYKSVRADLIPVLVKAIQEQQAMINELKAEVAALKGA